MTLCSCDTTNKAYDEQELLLFSATHKSTVTM